MTEIEKPPEKEEEEKSVNQPNVINPQEEKPSLNYSRSIIKSIIDSKELSRVMDIKLEKYKNATRKVVPNRKDKDYISKLEEGYESSDSGDSVQSSSTILSSTTSSTYSGMSYLSSFPADINTIIENEKNSQQKGGFFKKIYEEINNLKTIIPKEKSHDLNNFNNNSINTNENELKKSKIDNTYPLEYFEIFPNLNKYKIGNEANNVFIEKPILFVKNLISKNYHESLPFTQNKFQLQIFKNSFLYNYKIMNKSQPSLPPLNSEDITCMIIGYFKNNNTEKKNKSINNFNEVMSKLLKKQNIELNFIFFGYKNGLIRQNVLVTIKPDPYSEVTLPADSFMPYREYGINEIITEEKIDKHVLCMSLSDEQDYLLAGYASQHIIIWKTTDGKYLNVFDDIFEMPVVACEFLYVSENNKEFRFLVADLNGKVYLIQLQKNLIMKDDVNKIIVCNCSYPCLLMKKLRFNKYDGGEGFNIKNLINKIKERDYICILGNLEYIEIIAINSQLKNITSLLIIKNPDLNILNPMTEEIKKNRDDFYSQMNLRQSLSEIEFPDACFGLGFLGDLIKYDENDNKKNYPEILLAISWKNLIKLYFFSSKLDDIVEIGWYLNNCSIIKIDFIGVSLLYILDKNNNIKIINIKLFNHYLNPTSKFEKEEKKLKKNKFLIPVTDIITIENPVKTISKTFTETINFYNPFIAKNRYNIFLIEDVQKNKTDFFNNVRHIHLLSFREFFNETMRVQNWFLFFCKFIDIIKTGTNTLGYIPENKEIKENLLIEKEPIKLVKYEYLTYFLLSNQNIFDEDEDDLLDNLSNEDINFNYLSVAIEFAIEIGSIDFIYNEIRKLQNKDVLKKKLKKKLVEQLETFILNNKFQNDPNLISKELINDIIKQYLTGGTLVYIEAGNEVLFKLDLILCHLHMDILKKIDNIEKIIEDNKLSSSLIYYYSNGLNDFIKPLNYLFSEFVQIPPLVLPKENFMLNFFKRLKLSRGYYRDNYNALLKSLKSGNFNLEENLFKTKEYMGHLLLFYIQLTLKEKLFPHFEKISNYKFNSVKQEMFLFLTKKEVAEEFIKFDSYSYFETLSLFFFKEEEINMMTNEEMFETYLENNINKKSKISSPLMIEDIDENELKKNILEYNKISLDNNKTNKKENSKNINNDGDNNLNIINDEMPASKTELFFELINKLIFLCNNLPDNILIRFDLNFFIIQLSLKIDGIRMDILKSSLLSIMNFYNDIKKLKLDLNALSILFERIDRFGNHYSLIRRKQSSLDNISSIINFFINKYYIRNNANQDEINNLFKMFFSSYFLGVKIYLYELKKDYVNCINVYLNEKKKISRRVFPFINKTLNIINQSKDEKTLQIYKNEIKKKITNLARVSQSETFKIIQKWFNSIDIISSLNNLPKLQFRYIDKLKSIYKRKLKREREVINDVTKKEYSEILLIYIKLLFYFEKEKRVMKLLKDEEEYINVYECLKVCNKSIEASVYLYKLIGDEKSALKMCVNKIKENYKSLKSIKDKNNTIDERTENLFKEIKILIDESIDICENYSENSEIYKKRRNSSQISEEKNSEKNQKNEMGEEYWLELFGEIYNILNDSEKKEGLIFSKIKTHLTEKIENLLLTMSYYVSFNFILRSLSNEVQFDLIKNFLNKNIYFKSHLANLYKSYINLISYKINKDIKVVEKNGQKGKSINLIKRDEDEINSEKQNLIANRIRNYKFNYKYTRTNSYYDFDVQNKDNKIDNAPKIFKKCSLCSKMLNFGDYKFNNENSDVIIFQCDHIFHTECLKKEYSKMVNNLEEDNKIEDNFCPKCINIDTELFNFIDDKNVNIDIKEDDDENVIIINNNENLNEKEINFSAVENRKRRIKEKMKKKNFKKLNLLDNNYFEQINILENTLDGI